MKKEFLPYGDKIRQLLAKSMFTSSNLNNFLKSKGVFLGNYEKNSTVPFFMKTLLSPSSFIELRDTQNEKEDDIKVNVAKLNCSKDIALSEIVQRCFDLDLNNLIESNSTYKQNFTVKGQPQFYLESENTAILEYEIERTNYLDDWTNNVTTHIGTVTIQKDTDNISLSISDSSTAKEIKLINTLILKEGKKKLKQEKIVSQEVDYIKVKFSDFSNPSRIQFFYSFIKPICIYLNFSAISNIDVYLDEAEESPQDLGKFLDELESLKIGGRKLQDHILIKDKKYHNKIIFASIILKYKFDVNGVLGDCILKLSFPDYITKRDKNSELQYSIDFSIDKKSNKNNITENSLRKELTPFIDKHRIKSFEENKIILEGE